MWHLAEPHIFPYEVFAYIYIYIDFIQLATKIDDRGSLKQCYNFVG